MPLPIGNLGHAGFVKEASFGAGGTPTKFLPYQDESIVVDKGIITGIGAMGNRHEDHVALEGPQSIAGDIQLVAYPEELDDLLLAVFGAPTTNSLEAGSAGEHIFLSGKNAAVTSLALEVDRETRADRYTGVKINAVKFALSGSDDSPLVVTAGLIAQDLSSVSPTTPSYPTETPFIFHQVSTLTLGGTDIKDRVLSLEVNAENSLEERRALNGQKYPSAIDEGKAKVMGSIELYFDSADEYVDYLAATEQALVLELQGALIAGSTNYGLKLNLPKVVFTASPVNAKPDSQTVVPMEFTANHDSGVGAALEVKVTNATSTAP